MAFQSRWSPSFHIPIRTTNCIASLLSEKGQLKAASPKFAPFHDSFFILSINQLQIISDVYPLSDRLLVATQQIHLGGWPVKIGILGEMVTSCIRLGGHVVIISSAIITILKPIATW